MLKNKLLIIFSFFILFIILLATDCFGLSVDYNKQVYTFEEVEANNFNVCGVCLNSDGSFWIMLFSFVKEPTYYANTGFLDVYSDYTLFIIKPSEDLYYKDVRREPAHSANHATFYQIRDNLLYSNFDIKDAEGNVVFPKPVPQVVVELEKVEELPTLIIRLMIILLPIGLTIFSVVLVTYLIASKRWLHF